MSTPRSASIIPQGLESSRAKLFYKTAPENDWILLDPLYLTPDHNAVQVIIKHGISMRQKFANGAGACTLRSTKSITRLLVLRPCHTHRKCSVKARYGFISSSSQSQPVKFLEPCPGIKTSTVWKIFRFIVSPPSSAKSSWICLV